MANPAPQHCLISVRGTLGGAGATKETWQWGLRVSADFPGPQATRTTIVNAIKTFHTSAGSTISNQAFLQEVRFSNVGTNGLQIGATVIETAGLGVPGGFGVQVYPPQVALVVSLHTAGRGVGSQGRIYLPYPCAPFNQTDFLIGTAQVTSILAGVKTMLDGINAAFGAPARVSVVSRKAGGGAIAPVTYIRVGRVLDTMRSRRRSMAEGYTNSNLA